MEAINFVFLTIFEFSQIIVMSEKVWEKTPLSSNICAQTNILGNPTKQPSEITLYSNLCLN